MKLVKNKGKRTIGKGEAAMWVEPSVSVKPIPKKLYKPNNAWRDFWMLVFEELKVIAATDWLNNKLLKLFKWIKRGNLRD